MISELQHVLLSNTYKCSYAPSQTLTIAPFYDNSSAYLLKEQVCTDTLLMTILATLITMHNFICIVTSSQCGILFNCITIIRKILPLQTNLSLTFCEIIPSLTYLILTVGVKYTLWVITMMYVRRLLD